MNEEVINFQPDISVNILENGIIWVVDEEEGNKRIVVDDEEEIFYLYLMVTVQEVIENKEV